MAFFQERLRTSGEFATDPGADVVTSGTITDLANFETSYIRLTAATTLNSIVAGIAGKYLVLVNASAANLVVVNLAGGTLPNNILTGTGANITLAPGGSLEFVYDITSARWRALNGVVTTAATGFSVANALAIAASGTITLGSSGLQVIRVTGAPAGVTLSVTPFTATAPADGTYIVLIGDDSINFVSLTTNDAPGGAMLRTGVTLGKPDSITLQYNLATDRYVEICRNIKTAAERFPNGIVGSLTTDRVLLPNGGDIFSVSGTHRARVPLSYLLTQLQAFTSTVTLIDFANWPYTPANTYQYISIQFMIFQGGDTWFATVSGFYDGVNNTNIVRYYADAGITAVTLTNNGGNYRMTVTHNAFAAGSRFGSARAIVDGF